MGAEVPVDVEGLDPLEPEDGVELLEDVATAVMFKMIVQVAELPPASRAVTV
jgi:hypothetical protein